MVCRGGCYPPENNAFVQRNGRYEGLGETFFRRRFPRTLSKNLLKGYGRNALSRGILPTAKLWWIFAEDSRVCKHPLLILGQNPPNFSACAEIQCSRQGVNAFDLKAKYTDRSNIFKVTLAYRSNALLNRCSPKDEDLTLNNAFLKALPRVRSSFLFFESLGQAPCLGTEFRLAEGKFRWVFEKGLKKGCLQTFEDLSQKDTIVLPQAKCPETRKITVVISLVLLP